MKYLYLKGNLTVGLGTACSTNPDIIDYRLIFYKAHRPVAQIYFHPSTKTYAMRTMEVDLIETTLLDIIPYMNLKTFRQTRRWLLAGIIRYLET